MTSRNGSRGRGKKPDLVVPGEERSEDSQSNLPVRRGSVDDALVEVTSVRRGRRTARAVGDVNAGRRKFSYTDGTVAVNMKMDSAVHFALRLLCFETNLDQQYLINLAVRQFCQEHGVDPEAIREGKGYTVSFPGGPPVDGT